MKRAKRVLIVFLTFVITFLGELGLGACADERTNVSDVNSASIMQSSDFSSVFKEETDNFSQGLQYKLLSNDTYAVTDIGDCKDTEIIIPSVYNGKAVMSIEKDAFYLCHSLISVTIPDSVISIGESAFERCYSLTSIIIGKNVVFIGERAFSFCQSLTSIVIPDFVTKLGDYIFKECTNLLSVKIGNGVTSIGCNAFRDCMRLTHIELSDSVTSIGCYAFYNCSVLKTITLGNKLKSIGDYAFKNCASLECVYIKGSLLWSSISIGPNNDEITNVPHYGI